MTRIDPKPERVYPVYCGWCGVLLHWSPVEGSTGLCPECKRELLAKALAERSAQS